MSDSGRNEQQWRAIDTALAAGADCLTPDMYQCAVVAQVQTDTAERWPLGPIERVSPVRYMVKGLFEEYAETFERDQIVPSYHRMARLVLPSYLEYPFDEPGAIKRNIKEYGDLSWYLFNIAASHRINLAESLGGRTATFREIDTMARTQAMEASGLAWRLPGHNYVFHATELLQAVVEMGEPLPAGNVELFLKRRDHLARRASNLLTAVSVLLQSKFDTGLADVLYGNLVKVEERAATGTTLNAVGDDRELRTA